MSERKGKYISVEQPDQQVEVDFLSFNPETGVHVPGCTVKLSVSYKDGKATLYVYACDDGGNQPVLIDQLHELVIEDKDPTADESNACHYCGGNCPNEPTDSPNLCDGFQGDIDEVYTTSDEED